MRRGVLHHAVNPASSHRAVRNGVGVPGQSAAVFVISRAAVTFYELARAFTVLGARDALYLDGNVSEMHLPALDRSARGGRFGPILAVTRLAPPLAE